MPWYLKCEHACEMHCRDPAPYRRAPDGWQPSRSALQRDRETGARQEGGDYQRNHRQREIVHAQD